MLSAKLTAADDLAADNQARVRVASRRRPACSWSRRAVGGRRCGANDFGGPRGHRLAGRRAIAGRVAAESVVVFHGQVPHLAGLPLLVITPQGTCDLWDTSGTVPERQGAVQSVRRDLQG